MDFLRLPASLRRSIFSEQHIAASLRCLNVASTSASSFDDVLAPIAAASPGLLTLSSATLNSYNVSIPPSNTQLKYASRFFNASAPNLLFSAAHFRAFPPSPHPEVAFLGRSNVGKSSLLNALFGRSSVRSSAAKSDLAHVSKRPGRTRTMNGFGVSGGTASGLAPKEGQRDAAWKRFPRGGGCVVVDMPGYGGGSQEEWGKEALKYLENRRQLRRTFVLVDAEHGLKGSDVQLLTHLRRQGVAHQVVMSKVDKLLYPGARAPGAQKLSNGLMKVKDMCSSIRRQLDEEAGDGRESRMDILCCSAEKGLDEKNKHRKLGIDEVRWAVLSACGLECDEEGNRRRHLIQDVDILEDDVRP